MTNKNLFKKNRKSLILLFLMQLLLLFQFQNCAESYKQKTDEASQLSIVQSKSIAVLNNKCASCHAGESAYANASAINDPITNITNPDYLQATRLIIAGEPDLSPLFIKVQHGDMPPSPAEPLTAEEVELLQTWIGALSRSLQAGSSSSVQPGPTYSYIRNAIIPSCNKCHSTSNEPVYLNYDQLKAAVNGGLRGRLTSTDPARKMPRNSTLNPTDLSYFLGWIDSGAPNN